MTRPMTLDMVADRWQCSAETVRQMVKRGELRGFRVGRMIRIPWEAVENYECQTSASEDCVAGSASIGPAQAESECVVSLRHAPERKRRQKP
uniref:excisionase family DNA-binding protein n=1 Tax=Pseudodonghicola flavimaris TaxID=3050036 RepID=UPI00389B1AAA